MEQKQAQRVKDRERKKKAIEASRNKTATMKADGTLASLKAQSEAELAAMKKMQLKAKNHHPVVLRLIEDLKAKIRQIANVEERQGYRDRDLVRDAEKIQDAIDKLQGKNDPSTSRTSETNR